MDAKKTIEAALFISPKPLMLNDIGKIAGIHSLGHVKQILEELQKEYSERGIEVIQTQEGWHMQVRPQILPKVAHLTPYSDLSGGAKRTLALVVYKEPVPQSEIIKIQGNKAYSYIKDLLKRGLIKAEKKGHTKILYLTQEFERYFGEDKETIKERLRKMVEGGKEPVMESPEQRSPEPEETPQFIEDKKPKKEKAKAVVRKEEKPEEKSIQPSHKHAFEELE